MKTTAPNNRQDWSVDSHQGDPIQSVVKRSAVLLFFQSVPVFSSSHRSKHVVHQKIIRLSLKCNLKCSLFLYSAFQTFSFEKCSDWLDWWSNDTSVTKTSDTRESFQPLDQWKQRVRQYIQCDVHKKKHRPSCVSYFGHMRASPVQVSGFISSFLLLVLSQDWSCFGHQVCCLFVSNQFVVCHSYIYRFELKKK